MTIHKVACNEILADLVLPVGHNQGCALSVLKLVDKIIHPRHQHTPHYFYYCRTGSGIKFSVNCRDITTGTSDNIIPPWAH